MKLNSHYADQQIIDLTAFVDESTVIVQFISADFFFFIKNMNTTFPLNLAWLFRVKTPAPNSLPSLVVDGRAFEFTLTLTVTFFVERIPAVCLGIVICPTVTPWYIKVALVLSNLQGPKFVFFTRTWAVKLKSKEGLAGFQFRSSGM